MTYRLSNAHKRPWAPLMDAGNFSTLVSEALPPSGGGVTRNRPAPPWSETINRPSGRLHRLTQEPWLSRGTECTSSILKSLATLRRSAGVALPPPFWGAAAGTATANRINKPTGSRGVRIGGASESGGGGMAIGYCGDRYVDKEKPERRRRVRER